MAAAEQTRHEACVDAWMAARGEVPDALLGRLLGRGLGAVCRRATPTLGDVTVDAIFERVAQDALERAPVLAELGLEARATCVATLEPPLLTVRDAAAARAAIRAVLVELLTVLGELTAEILTPGLHAELAAARLDDDVHAPSANEGRS